MCQRACRWLIATALASCPIAITIAQDAAPVQQSAAPAGVASTAAQQIIAPPGSAQQNAQAVGQQVAPAPQQVPGPFQLNIVQQAALNQVLDAWQRSSGNISTFQCSFERFEYNNAFGPGKNIPLNKNEGKLTYQKPDKGSIEITQIKVFRQLPAQPGQQAGAAAQVDWLPQPDAIGEHWVCDGKSVFEYRANQKQVVEHPIPPALQGQAIADGPLPFLFGADANKLKARYWMKIDEQNNNPAQVWIIAQPKFQQQAADFKEVDVILDKQQLLPQYMQVWMPNGDHHVYIFDMKSVQINNLFGRLQGFFTRPSIPFGWKHVVEAAPLQQAAQPVPPPR